MAPRLVLAPMLLVGFLTIAIRWYDQNYQLAKHFVSTQPSAEQLAMPTPPFCSGIKPGMEENMFYFDLGGTYCACEKQWNIGEYWRKTMSGLAFNLPHFIDALVACLIFGDLKLIAFVVFINEFVEEFVVAVSPHWGFNGDPAWDVEPRYDSLMRDVVHCMVGIWLASSVMRITYQTGWMDASGMLSTRSFVDFGPSNEAPRGIFLFHPRHIRLIFTQEGTEIAAREPTSSIRFWRHAIAFTVFWQIFLLYNLDAGIRALSVHNILLTALVALWFVGMFHMNSCHMPKVPHRRLAVQHAVPAVICCVSCASCIYPPMPTIYLIMLLEGTSKISLTLFEVVLAKFPKLRSWMQLNVENDEIDAEEVLRKAMSQLDCGRDSGVPLGRVSLANIVEATTVSSPHTAAATTPNSSKGDLKATKVEGVISVDMTGDWDLPQPVQGQEVTEKEPPSIAAQRLGSMLRQLRDEKVRNNCPLSTGKGRFRTAFNIIFSLSIMIFALNQPFMYEGTKSLSGETVNIQYARHWCGNPNGPRDNVNTCLGPPGSSDGH